MTKPYSADDFSNQLVADRVWRIKEISDLKSAILSGDKNLQKVLLRALVTLGYAHWEGHVRFSARKYLEHVSLRKLKYSELNKQFLKNYFLPRLAGMASSKASLRERCDIIESILTSSEERFSRPNEDLVNTKANLSSEVIKDICLVCNIPTKFFEENASFIDILLLKRRNSIAHGEDTFVDSSDLDDLIGKTIAIMRAFGDELDNQVCQKNYLV